MVLDIQVFWRRLYIYLAHHKKRTINEDDICLYNKSIFIFIICDSLMTEYRMSRSHHSIMKQVADHIQPIVLLSLWWYTNTNEMFRHFRIASNPTRNVNSRCDHDHTTWELAVSEVIVLEKCFSRMICSFIITYLWIVLLTKNHRHLSR
jgi:hypothetical protein